MWEMLWVTGLFLCAVRSLHTLFKTCDHILSSKSDLFSLGIGLHLICTPVCNFNGPHLKTLPWWYCQPHHDDREVTSLLFADDDLLAPLPEGPQCSLELLVAECDAAEIQINNSKSEVIVLCGKVGHAPFNLAGIVYVRCRRLSIPMFVE